MIALHQQRGGLTAQCILQGRDHGIRYHSLHDNKYIRYFTGHTERVTGLCLSPSTDLFLSSGEVGSAPTFAPRHVPHCLPNSFPLAALQV